MAFGAFIGQSQAQNDRWSIVNEQAVGMFKRGQFVSGTPIAKQALDLAVNAESPKAIEIITSLNVLASYYKAQNNFTAAEQLYRKALLIGGKTQPTRDNVIAALYGLGDVYFMQGNYVLAEPIFRKTIVLSHTTETESQQQLGEVYNKLAIIYRYTGRAGEANELEQASGLAKKVNATSPH
jgi:tetratricopeptide (TPR) repeat protein